MSSVFRGPRPMLFTTPYERLTIRRLPWASFLLAALWLLVAAAVALWPGAGWERLAWVPEAPTLFGFGGHWLLHESWAHLAVALALVLAIGPVLEDAWGSRFTASCFALLVPVTAGAYLLAEGESQRGLVGASGLLAALLGACFLRQLREGIRYTAIGWWRGVAQAHFQVPAYVLLGVWFVGEVLMQHADDGQGATRGVSYAGQAAGAALGLALAYTMRRFSLEERWLNRSQLRAFHPALAAAERVREQSGDAAELALLVPAVAREPDEVRLVAALCRAAVAVGEPDRARAPFTKAVRAKLSANEPEAAARLWQAWSEPLARPDLGAQSTVSLASALAAHQRIEAAKLLRRLLDAPAPLSNGLLLRILDVARPIHAGVAIRAANLALEGADFAQGKREHIESLVRELEARRALELDPQLDDDEPVRKPEQGEPLRESDDGAIELASEDEPGPPLAQSGPETIAERASFELSADGSLSGTGSDFELAAPEEPVPDTQPILGVQPTESGAPNDPRDGEDPEDATDPIIAHGLDLAARETRFAEAKCLEVVPLALEPGRLSLQQSEGRTAWLELDQVQAIAAGAVAGLAERPVILIDLLLNWSEVEDEVPLRILRMRSDRFDPASLVPDAAADLDGFRSLLDALLAGSPATPLPDAEQAAGRPFARFDRPEAYEREVLLLER